MVFLSVEIGEVWGTEEGEQKPGPKLTRQNSPWHADAGKACNACKTPLAGAGFGQGMTGGKQAERGEFGQLWGKAVSLSFSGEGWISGSKSCHPPGTTVRGLRKEHGRRVESM